MFKILAKRFIKDYQSIENQNIRLKLISLSGLVGVIINIFLFIIKIIIGILASSSAIMGDAFNNMSDALTSLITLIGAKASRKPADKNHPYGHGRSEYIASFIVSILIMIVGFLLFTSSVENFYNGKLPKISKLSIMILIFSLGFKFYIYFLNKDLDKRLDSKLNFAVMVDARNDIL